MKREHSVSLDEKQKGRKQTKGNDNVKHSVFFLTTIKNRVTLSIEKMKVILNKQKQLMNRNGCYRC